MTADQLEIALGAWVYRHFMPNIDSYCDILLNRIDPIFMNVDAEEKRAYEEFLTGAPAYYADDDESAYEAAHEHAQEHCYQFIEMRSVFLATGVSGLFHLFEKQLYLHINKELKGWLTTPVTSWRDLDDLIPKFDRKWREDVQCLDFVEAFRDADLKELRLVANTIKHGSDGQSYKELVRSGAVVVDEERVKEDWTAGPYSTFGVSLSVQVDDVRRYQAAIRRFWEVDGTFCAARSAFK
jgi:hypothetical protein